MHKTKILFLSLLAAGCASAPPAPIWYSNPLLDTQEAIYVSAKGVGETEKKSVEHAYAEAQLQLVAKLDEVTEKVAEQYGASTYPTIDPGRVKTLMKSIGYKVLDGATIKSEGEFTSYLLLTYDLGDVLFLLNVRMRADLDKAMGILAEENKRDEERRKKEEERIQKLRILDHFKPELNWYDIQYDNWISYDVMGLQFQWIDHITFSPYSFY